VWAEKIQVWNTNDNLDSQCTFGWQLLTASGAYVDTGSVFCAGQDYTQWDGNRNYPYTYVAGIIGVTLL
jgi:hypothetical protein